MEERLDVLVPVPAIQPLPKTLFLVGAVGYEYNDEIYYRGESGGVTPTNLYVSKKEAKKEVLRLTRKAIAGMSSYDGLGAYGYSTDEIVNDLDQFSNVLVKYDADIDVEEMYESSQQITEAAKKMTDEDFELFVDSLELEFYEIVEVEVA